MKFPSFILAVASVATLDNGANALSTGLLAAKCLDNNPNAFHAIKNFCNGNSHITVPSTYSDTGKHYGNTFAKIGADSTCNPPQWVPRKYCRSQFYDICTTGTGRGTKVFNGCQSFHIGKITLARRGEESAEVDDEYDEYE